MFLTRQPHLKDVGRRNRQHFSRLPGDINAWTQIRRRLACDGHKGTIDFFGGTQTVRLRRARSGVEIAERDVAKKRHPIELNHLGRSSDRENVRGRRYFKARGKRGQPVLGESGLWIDEGGRAILAAGNSFVAIAQSTAGGDQGVQTACCHFAKFIVGESLVETADSTNLVGANCKFLLGVAVVHSRGVKSYLRLNGNSENSSFLLIVRIAGRKI